MGDIHIQNNFAFEALSTDTNLPLPLKQETSAKSTAN